MKQRRLTLLTIFLFALILLPAASYANNAAVGRGTDMNMPGNDMSGHTMEIPSNNISGQGAADNDHVTGNTLTPTGGTSAQNMDMSNNDPADDDMTGYNMGDIPDQSNDGMSHDMPAETPAHNMNMPDHGGGTIQDNNDHQAAGTGHGDINPSGKEVNRASLLGGFGLVNGFIVLAAVILKRKLKWEEPSKW